MSQDERKRLIESTELAYRRLGDAYAEIIRRRHPGNLIVKTNHALALAKPAASVLAN